MHLLGLQLIFIQCIMKVGQAGLEPATSASSVRRSPTKLLTLFLAESRQNIKSWVHATS